MFAAYNSRDADKCSPPNSSHSTETGEWLRNKSFVTEGSKVSAKKKKRHGSDERKTKKHNKKRRSISRTRKRSRSHSEERLPSRDELIAKHSLKKTFIEEVGISPQHAFREDRTGEQSFVGTPSLPNRITASYKKYWKRPSDELCSTKCSRTGPVHRNSKRYHHKEFLREFTKTKPQSIPKINDNPRELPPFVPISNFEIIHENVDEDDENFELNAIQLKTKCYNEELRRNPSNVDTWLEYVDFQDKAMEDSKFVVQGDPGEKSDGTDRKKKKSRHKELIRTKAVVERKLSILKKALDHNPKSVALSIKRLTLSKEILDSATINRQWKELILLFPSNIQVWDSYLMFLSSHFTSFTLSAITEAYKEFMQRLQRLKDQAFQDNSHVDCEQQLTHVTIRLWHLWARAGHRERSIAHFQALVEFNLFAPSFPGYYSNQDKLATFEPFWDSSVPRFGEENATGWAQSPKHSDCSQLAQEEADDYEDELLAKFGNKVDPAQLWLQFELLRERKHWLPRRVGVNDDDDSVDDTERVILFDQLDGFIFQIRDQRQMFKLLLGFLHFAGLGDLFSDQSGTLGYLGTQTFQDWLGINHPETLQQDDQDSSGILLEVETNRHAREFIKSVFLQAANVFQEPFRTQIILLYIKFEANHLDEHQESLSKAKKAKAKEIKAAAMKFLERDQANIAIYIGYAMALDKLEGYKSAKKVFDLAFQGLQSDCDSLLYAHAAKLELNYGHEENALWMLILLAHQRPFEPCQLTRPALLDFSLGALQKLTKSLEPVSTNDDYKRMPVLPHDLPAPFALAWLTYLTDGYEGVGALPAPPGITGSPHVHDAFFKLKCDILSRHPSLLKRVNLQWIQQFPRSLNALDTLLGLNVQTAVSSGFWRSLHSALTHKSCSSPIGHLAVAKTMIKQLKLMEEDHGLLFKLWKLLNTFVQSEPCRRNIQTWRLLMWATKRLSLKDPVRYQPKTIFYRGIQDNPSAKVLGLDLIYHLELSSNASEALQTEIQNIYTEKEVRLRMPMEELKVLLIDE